MKSRLLMFIFRNAGQNYKMQKAIISNFNKCFTVGPNDCASTYAQEEEIFSFFDSTLSFDKTYTQVMCVFQIKIIVQNAPRAFKACRHFVRRRIIRR